MGLTIGVDIGGTKVAAGLVDEAGTILQRTRQATPGASPRDVEDIVAACVRELAQDRQVQAVGIGAAGFISADRSRVLFAPNLAWRDEPLRDAVQERTGLPPSAMAPALAEAERRGLLASDADRLLPTARGFDFLSDLQAMFLPPAEPQRPA